MHNQTETKGVAPQSLAFGVHSSKVAWIPQTPREQPYISEFRPTSKDHWMSDLRVASQKVSGVEVREETPELRRYYFKKEVSQAVLDHRERYKKLLSGGEAHALVKTQVKLQEGQNIFRLCRFFGPGKATTRATSPVMNPKDKKVKSEKKETLKSKPQKEITFAKLERDSSDDSGCNESVETLKKQAFLKGRKNTHNAQYMVFDDQEELTKEQELWTDIAFTICSKSKQDIQELVRKVSNYNKPSELSQKSSNRNARRGSRRQSVKQRGESQMSTGKGQRGFARLNQSPNQNLSVPQSPNPNQSPNLFQVQQNRSSAEQSLYQPNGSEQNRQSNVPSQNDQLLMVPGITPLKQSNTPISNNQPYQIPYITQPNLIFQPKENTVSKQQTTKDPFQPIHPELLSHHHHQHQHHSSNINIQGEREEEPEQFIEEGRHLKNGGQQFYEDLLRQQRVITDLVNNRPQISTAVIEPSSPMKTNQLGQSQYENYSIDQYSGYRYSERQFIQPIMTMAKEQYFATRQFDSKVMGSTLVHHRKMQDEIQSQRGDSSTHHGDFKQFSGVKSKHSTYSESKRTSRGHHGLRSLRISAAGIETLFNSSEQRGTDPRNVRYGEYQAMTDRGHSMQDIEAGNAPDLENNEDEKSVQSQPVQGFLTKGEGRTLIATARSSGVGGLNFKRQSSYYRQQELLYGSGALSVGKTSLIARAHHEYQRIEQERLKDQILDENKRKIILKV